MKLKGSTILITGGTGSFGNAFVRIALAELDPARLVIFSRDELKQSEMAKRLGDDRRVRFFLGDVRDRWRLRRAMHGVDLVVHAAALKQVPACEYNPFEAVQTNILGATNVIEAAIDEGVKRVVAISTDKAVNPVNLYGATKLCAEKLFIQGNAYAGGGITRFANVRYGNVIGSRGSVIPLFIEQRESGRLTITDERMTRFFLTVEQGVRLVLRAATEMDGGEVFIPRVPSVRITDIAEAVAPGCKVVVTGIRPGEKLHEVLVSSDEARHARERGDCIVVYPEFAPWGEIEYRGQKLPDGFEYSSNGNDCWLSGAELRKLAGL